MPTSTRYFQQELIAEGGEVKTFRGRDPLNGLPVRIYRFAGEPTAQPGELRSPHIPLLLFADRTEADPTNEQEAAAWQGQIVTVFSHAYKPVEAPLESPTLAALFQQTATALDDAAKAGVVHGDICPERLFYIDDRSPHDRRADDRSPEDARPPDPAPSRPTRRYLLEGYGAPWGVRASETTPPERITGASYAGDIFSWAMTMRTLSGALSGGVRDLLSRCLSADPKSRPHAHEVCAALAGPIWKESAQEREREASSPPLREPPSDEPEHTREPDPERARGDAAQGDTTRADSAHGDSAHGDSVPNASVGVHSSSAAAEGREAGKRLAGDLETNGRETGDPNAGDGAADSIPERVTNAPPKARVRTQRPTPEGFSGFAASHDSLDDLRGAFDRPPEARVVQSGAAEGAKTEVASPLDEDALRRTDATAEYRRRREHLQTQRGASEAPIARAAEAVGSPVPFRGGIRVLPSPDPKSPSAESLSHEQQKVRIQKATTESASTEEEAKKTRLRRAPQTFAMSEEDDFDDIDDRAPDPTAARGGLRVLLLSLLVVATLVLLALLLFNP